MLFDENYYLRMNQARWEVAQKAILKLKSQVKDCLDAGCGPGWFSDKISSLGIQVTGMDTRQELIQVAKQRVPAARFVRADVEASEQMAAIAPADMVFCFGLLYHTENPFRAIRNLQGAAKKFLFLESILCPADGADLRLVEENNNETQGMTRFAFIPSRGAFLKMFAAAGFSCTLEYTGPVEHEDFKDTPTKNRRRGIFLASYAPIALPGFSEALPVAAPKIDFTKKEV